ncbi:MAG TPA: SDR family NAD(P)-dependent oxidoreductase [Acidimicrobiales bacterium]|nr:SDR family NAD(P)-dependent oxidoreductase [Acidimicrobiales bacterium]
MYELRGSVAVVTGASAGLGRRFALDMARRGAVVVGLARRAALLATLADELRALQEGSSTRACDVSDTGRFVEVLGEIEHEHGSLDVLVNNAGIGPPRHESHPDLAAQRRIFETNYFAAVAGTLAVLPGMLARRRGVVVNVSSDSGRAPGPDDSAYGASKAALSAFTESLAFDTEGTGVHLHVLYPGWVPTAMGQGAVDAGMPMPPKMARRTDEEVSRLLLERMGSGRIDIDAVPIARLALVGRAVAPGVYRRGVRRTSGPRPGPR